MSYASTGMERGHGNGHADSPTMPIRGRHGAAIWRHLRPGQALATISRFVCVLLCAAVLAVLVVGARLVIYGYLQWGDAWPHPLSYGVPHDTR